MSNSNLHTISAFPILWVAVLTGLVVSGPRTAHAQASQPATPVPPPITIAGREVPWSDLGPLLAEAAGAEVLEEILLERELTRRTADAALTIGPAEIDAERQLLIDTLAAAAGRAASAAAPSEASGEVLLAQVRRTRGLGDRRFQSLLWRNAALRALVRAQSDLPAITADDLAQAFALRHGPKARIRLIVVSSAAEAAELRAAVLERDASKLPAPPPPPDRPAPAALWAFTEAASTRSIDPSRLRGGLLDPISPADPGYPVAIRRALELLEPGQVSPAIAVSWPSAPGQVTEGYALVYMQERLPAPPDGVSLEAATPALEREIRTVRERARMERLARDMLPAASSQLLIFDPSLSRAWEERATRP